MLRYQLKVGARGIQCRLTQADEESLEEDQQLFASAELQYALLSNLRVGQPHDDNTRYHPHRHL